jgi:cytochrome P450
MDLDQVRIFFLDRPIIHICLMNLVGFPRKAMQPIKFSDDTVVPAGAFVSPAFTAHFDEFYYKDALTFNPARFSEGASGVVNTSNHFLPFGHGNHSW